MEDIDENTYSQFKKTVNFLIKNNTFIQDVFSLFEDINKLDADLKKALEEKFILDKKLAMLEKSQYSIQQIKEAVLLSDVIGAIKLGNLMIIFGLLIEHLNIDIQPIQKIINFFDLPSKNSKTIIALVFFAYILHKIDQHYSDIKKLQLNGGGIGKEDLENNQFLITKIACLNNDLESKNKHIKVLNEILGVELVALIQELNGVFLKYGNNISWLDAIQKMPAFKEAKKNKNIFSFYQLIASSFLIEDKNILDKENIKRFLNIREHSYCQYSEVKDLEGVSKLYGDSTLKIVEEVSTNIVSLFNDLSQDQINQNYFFCGAPGIGKTQIVKNVIKNVIEKNNAKAVAVFEIKNFDIQSVDDIRSLGNTIDNLLRENIPVLVIIDEADGIFKNRANVENSENNNTIITEMLQFIDKYKRKKVSILAITNYKERLDSALIRDGRFHTWELFLPDYKERIDIATALLEASGIITTNLIKHEHEVKNMNPVKRFLGIKYHQKKITEGALSVFASTISFFTVTDSQATIIEKTYLFIRFFKEQGEDDIDTVVSKFFKTIHDSYLQNNKIDRDLPMKIVRHIRNQGDDKEVSEYAKKMAALQDKINGISRFSEKGDPFASFNYDFKVRSEYIEGFNQRRS